MVWRYLELNINVDKIIWAKSELRYESTDKNGITIHQCDCGRKMCRSNYCVKCWEEEIKELQAGGDGSIWSRERKEVMMKEYIEKQLGKLVCVEHLTEAQQTELFEGVKKIYLYAFEQGRKEKKAYDEGFSDGFSAGLK